MLRHRPGHPGLLREVEVLGYLGPFEELGHPGLLREQGHLGLFEELEEQGRLADAGHPLLRRRRRRSQTVSQRHLLGREAPVLVPGVEVRLRGILRMTAPTRMVMMVQRLSRRRG